MVIACSAATDESKRWQRLEHPSAAMLVMLVGFSRIALGAHYSVTSSRVFSRYSWLMICALLFKADATERGGAGWLLRWKSRGQRRGYSVRAHGDPL